MDGRGCTISPVPRRALRGLPILALALLALALWSPGALADDEVRFLANGDVDVIGDVGQNRIVVDDANANASVSFEDPDANLSQVGGPSCSGNGTHLLTCPGSPEERRIRVFGRGGDDDVSLFTSTAAGSALFGEGGKDTLLAGAAAALNGGSGDDQLSGGSGVQVMIGEGGDDLLQGLGSNDELDGGDGDDTLKGGAGDDTLDGGKNKDSIDGGADTDVVEYPDHSAVVVSLDGAANDGNNSDEAVVGTGARQRGGSGEHQRLPGRGHAARKRATPTSSTAREATTRCRAWAARHADRELRRRQAGRRTGFPDIASYEDHADAVVASTVPGGTNNGNSIDGPVGQRDELSAVPRGSAGDRPRTTGSSVTQSRTGSRAWRATTCSRPATPTSVAMTLCWAVRDWTRSATHRARSPSSWISTAWSTTARTSMATASRTRHSDDTITEVGERDRRAGRRHADGERRSQRAEGQWRWGGRGQRRVGWAGWRRSAAGHVGDRCDARRHRQRHGQLCRAQAVRWWGEPGHERG